MTVRSVVAVIVGGVIDIVATNVFLTPLIVFVMLRENLVHADAGALARIMTSEPAVAACSFVLGAVASLIGGYAAAWIAGRRELLVGALSAYLCVGLHVWSVLHPTVAGAPADVVVGFLLSPAVGALGGAFRLLQTRRRLARA